MSRRADLYLAAAREHWAAKANALASLNVRWSAYVAGWQADEKSWEHLLAADGLIRTAQTAATHALATLRNAVSVEERHAADLVKLSATVRTVSEGSLGAAACEETSADAVAAAALLRSLAAAARANADRQLASASAAKEKALRVSRALTHLELVNGTEQLGIHDACKAIRKHRAALTKSHAAVAASFDELRKEFDRQSLARATEDQICGAIVCRAVSRRPVCPI